MKRTIAIVLSATLLASPVGAQDCSSSVQSAQDNVRNGFIQGMSGLISGSFSNRPASMASMACLDKFLQGNMDIMFKPPTLTDLLGTILNFACQTAKSSTTPTASSQSLNSLIGSVAGGLNLGTGGTVNLSQVLSSVTSATGAASSGSGAGGTSGTGGINGLYKVPGH